jgi:hypothetical protein
MKNLTTKKLTVALGALAVASSAQASTDYGPAIWHAICNANWYTTGSGHKFHVIHDMEGYYASTVAYFDNCSMTSASVHFAVNGLKDATSDAPAGEITQLGVRTSQYAWHARCWNQHSTGTEHEGFVSNPAWYTEAQYVASAGITAHMAAVFGWAKDRNHIVGHNEKSRAAWVSWASANLGIDPNCNTHSDPGANWNWSHYMALVNPSTGKTAVEKDNTAGTATGTWSTGTSSTDKYGADYRFHSTAAISEPFTWTTGLNTSATWNVKAWWTQGANRSASAPYIVTTASGTTTVNKNQQSGGGGWQTLGSWSMSTGKVELSCWAATGFVVVADAIRWD